MNKIYSYKIYFRKDEKSEEKIYYVITDLVAEPSK